MERYRDLGAHFPHVFGANVSNHETTFWKRHEFSVGFNDGGTPATVDVDFRGLVVAPFRMMVVGAYVTAIDAGGIAASAVNYKTITVRNWGATGAPIAATITTIAGFTRYVPRTMILSTTLANLIVERGEILEVALALDPGLTGIAMNQCGVTIIAKAIE